jgi:RimJ/RimL family protein N-acetyltransferase
MDKPILTVRELQQNDIEFIANYWLNSPKDYLTGMGVDLDKLPEHDEWIGFLSQQITQNYKDQTSYCIIWELDGKPIGHSNTNKIIFGHEAYMHLHIWAAGNRSKGLGTDFIILSIPHFFNHLNLKSLYCETYILNPSPNKALKKAGFTIVKQYLTTPGWINFEQLVNLWEMSLDSYESFKDKISSFPL